MVLSLLVSIIFKPDFLSLYGFVTVNIVVLFLDDTSLAGFCLIQYYTGPVLYIHKTVLCLDYIFHGFVASGDW